MTEGDTLAGPTVPNDGKGVGQRDGSKTCGRQQSDLQELSDQQRGRDQAKRDPLKLNAHSKVSESKFLVVGEVEIAQIVKAMSRHRMIRTFDSTFAMTVATIITKGGHLYCFGPVLHPPF